MDYIEGISRYNITLFNKTIIPVSRRKYKAVEKRLIEEGVA